MDYVRVGYKHKVGFRCQRARGETGGKFHELILWIGLFLAAQMYHNEPLAMKGFESIFSRTWKSIKAYNVTEVIGYDLITIILNAWMTALGAGEYAVQLWPDNVFVQNYKWYMLRPRIIHA